MKHATAWAVLALLALGGDGQAQETTRGVRIIPSIGSYLPTGDVGQGRGPGDGAAAPELLSLSRGVALGLAVEAPVLSTWSVRGGVKYGFASDLVAGNEAGEQSCGASCSAAVYDRTALTGAAALLVSTDLAVRPAPAAWALQPYAMGGLAFRRHFYDEGVIPAGRAAARAAEQAARWVPHLGVGAEWPVRSLALRLEAEMFGDVEWDGWRPRGGAYGDAFLSLGLSWAP